MDMGWVVGLTEDGTPRVYQASQEPKGFQLYSRREDEADAWDDLAILEYENKYGEDK